MVGTVINERPVDSIRIAGEGPAGQKDLEELPPGSEESCSSCGARIEHEASRCPWCGRVVLKDAVLDSNGEPDSPPMLPGRESFAPCSSTRCT